MKRVLSPEEVCMEYAVAAKAVRDLSALVKPWNCTNVSKYKFSQPYYSQPTPHGPCISELFEMKHESGVDFDAAVEDFEEDMCDACKVSLKAVRERKEARRYLSKVKRRVDAVGKRLNAQGVL